VADSVRADRAPLDAYLARTVLEHERETRTMNLIELDGSQGEGGGQILRSGLALAMCTGRPLALKNIRAKRSKPGLMRQHLACVQAAAAVSGARVEGAELGSQTLRFEPGSVRAGDYSFKVGSAGSCTLVLQTVLPALMLADAPSRLSLSGGTHNPMAPPFHFLQRCFVPLLQKLGVGLGLELRRHGFFPAGGGEILATLEPAQASLVAFDVLERGARREAYAECISAALPMGVAARELSALGGLLGWPAEHLHVRGARQNEGPGNALMATLAYEHVCELATSFGEKGLSAEQVAGTLAAEVKAFEASDGALGPHLADQWMLPLALAIARHGGQAAFSCSEVTEHARTNIDVIERFLPVRFAISGDARLSRIDVAARP
jgi:RNA 3'-terminal phosphate cyclase (ATP)